MLVLTLILLIERRYDGDAGNTVLELQTASGPSYLKGTKLGDTDTRFEIFQNGDYYFAGTGTFRNAVLNLEPDNDANYTVTTEEYEEQEEVTPYVPAVPATYDEEGNELTAEVPAVEATYQTVTKTREIRTYSGPTLDVKAVIQELQQRVADRDAVIADFTTRLAALEADHATLMNNNGGY